MFNSILKNYDNLGAILGVINAEYLLSFSASDLKPIVDFFGSITSCIKLLESGRHPTLHRVCLVIHTLITKVCEINKADKSKTLKVLKRNMKKRVEEKM